MATGIFPTWSAPKLSLNEVKSLHPDDGDSMEPPKRLYPTTTQPEDFDLKHHRRESLKT
jgi:hypothetical protein